MAAGQSCPATGWWSCADHEDGAQVVGGDRQYFREGERMPQALLAGPASLLDKVKRKQPTYSRGTPTVWKRTPTDEKS